MAYESKNDKISDSEYPEQTVFTASAPGRMDVMGGIADYSGSLVLQMPIRQHTTASVTLRNDYRFHITSISKGDSHSEFTADYRSLLLNGQPNYDHARAWFKESAGGNWAAYVLGCFIVLQIEKNIQVTGADIVIESDVPLGKGVSSSAALEVAVMKAAVLAYGIRLPGNTLPILAQMAENRVVGAPCGLMDQLASYLGEENKLLPIVCQPDLVQTLLEIPAGLRFVGIDSGVKHSVGGASYSDVRIAAFMGYSIIAQQCGASIGNLENARKTGNWQSLPYKGYLANISPSEFDTWFKGSLPIRLTGSDFLSQFGCSTDTVTQIDKQTVYEVQVCTAHPVYENQRVNQFKLLLAALHHIKPEDELRESYLQNLGELMYQSHASYSACGLGNSHTDELVNMVRQDIGNGVYGAKITGGGSGGTVTVLTSGPKGYDTAKEIYKQYSGKHKLDIVFFD